ncbi:MAG: hypothetical protein QOH25_2564 [Acidobacteriota bacterium]|jgi:hypothetical protein|nr:hypothetical protein [Acidobacteriota bacterium]
MKVRRIPRTLRSLKVICLLLFCALASMTFVSRFKADAESTTPLTSLAPELAPAAENHPPEMDAIRFKRVGVGQRIFFGISVIDEETDDIRVEMTQKPASAKYNERTLTVDWTPKKSDGRVGQFAVRITEYPRDGHQPRTMIKTFSIEIAPKPVPLPVVPPAPLAVETLISITDPERLAAANARWPIIAMFDRIAAIEASKQIKPDNGIQPTTGAGLFRDALRNLALLHRNDEINPDSPKFNPQFNAENWRLIMVRPRVNKRIFELRLVYKNVVAAEPIFLMPRMRITRLKDPELDKDDAARQKNNKTFATMFHSAFFDGADLKPFIARDKKSYGEALADFISSVVNYSDKDDPNMQANFAALPHNARLGGDDSLDEKGRYLRGDGWALGVMKVVPVERNGQKVLAFSNLPIDGFATSIKPLPDNSAFRRVPAPAFDPKSASFITGFDKLVDVGNFSAIPDDHDVTMPKPAMIDSSMFSRDFKQKQMVAETSLRDPRRRLFEERGMTCIQCHVRNFDEGDYLNPGVKNPKEGSPGTARDIPRLFFVITPDEVRSEFFRRNEEEQVGNLKGVLRDYLDIKVNLESPLAADWPFKTRAGRS